MDNNEQLSQRDIRSLIFHLLYAMEAYDYQVSLNTIVEQFNAGFDLSIDPEDPLVKKAQAIIDDREVLDQEIQPLLSNWRLDRIGCITRLIIRLALWELKYTDTPASIIINEAIELAKCFAEQDAYKFVNGVLDQWVSSNRPEEKIARSNETDETKDHESDDNDDDSESDE